MRSTGVARGGKLAEQLAYSGSIRYGKRGSRGIGGSTSRSMASIPVFHSPPLETLSQLTSKSLLRYS